MMTTLSFYTVFVWKTLQRNRGRTLFILLAVALAAFVSLAVMAVLQGMSKNLEEAVVRNNVGDYQFQDNLFSSTGESSSPSEFNQLWKEKLESLGINKYSPELVFEGYLSTPEGDAALSVLGIEPAYHEKFLGLSQHLKSGTFFNGNIARPIVIGMELAKDFKLHVGDRLALNYQDRAGELRAEIMTVAGIFDYSSKSFQSHSVYVLQSDWQKLFLGEDSGKILFNRLPMMDRDVDRVQLGNLATEMNLRLKTWKDENPEMSVAVDFNNLMIRFCLLITAFTILLTITGPVQILWEEREAELRTLRVIGIGKWKVMGLGAIEFFMIFLFSITLAFVFLGAFYFFSTNGIDLNFLNKGVKIERAGIIIDWLINPTLAVKDFFGPLGLILIVLSLSYGWGITVVIRRLNRSAV